LDDLLTFLKPLSKKQTDTILINSIASSYFSDSDCLSKEYWDTPPTFF
jgi:hypothetical protein